MTLIDEDVSGCGENEDANETEDNEPYDMAYFDNVAGTSTEKEYNVQPKIATGVEKILSEGLSALLGPNVNDRMKEVNESLRVARTTRRYQPYQKRRFPFLGQRQQWKTRGGGSMSHNPYHQRAQWHQTKRGGTKRK
ncbi:hypothetical protein ElyMa_000403500 [Elysia marginata]|uniref:Uncharacterized protein n=1 Tax=Elysia marginata TaxID=1093978 RepID=A0AAV4FJ63_9GAST|nr:hypothetical protein ElyMa_000403500 [Elysia marginata]